MKKFMAFVMVVIMIFSCMTGCGASKKEEEVIKIGSVWGLTGAEETQGQICSKAVQYAVKVVNDNGGINGKKLEVVEEDYQSDTTVIVEKTQKLLLEDEVTAIIGPAMLSGIQAMIPTVEENDGLAICPIPFTGEMDSDNTVFTGGCLYTQLEGMVKYMQENYGKKVFIVGSDYSYPVRISAYVQAIVEENGGEVVGDEYLPIGETDCSTVINKIKNSGANYIIHSCVSDTIYAFHQQVIDYGLTESGVGIGTLITTETDAASLGKTLEGTYSAYNWFNCMENEMSKEFVEGFKKEYGEEEAAKLNGNAECCYTSILLLAEALKNTDDYSAASLREAMGKIEIDSPQGKFSLNPDQYYYANTYSLMVEWDDKGNPSLIDISEKPIDAQPYPTLLYPDGKTE